MSNPDSFIDEVTEEVRRDRLYRYLKRYGWIAILLVIVIVGGAAWREYSASREDARAQAFGTAVLEALDAETPTERATELQDIEAPEGGAQAVLKMLIAGEQAAAEDADPEAARQTLTEVATSGAAPVYRQIASYKALTREGVPAEDRRIGFEAMVQEGGALRLLAEEQLALLEIEAGDTEAALERLEAIRQDSEVSQGLRLRASQLIVALGGSVEEGS
ncbi:hypothetical protein OCH239_01355 [Roseivivax halodurans JCM 10272]|uniref:Ancillary SecYEG translocon subunit/Cell division coordinator CpoB TPR domain-containing protein n=1 Tax=Roseivivax halodurans JCM 10272 TaxID=1449350 RepID=X7EMU6_9RHOB|nr:tetratricopeptide repeat protein [Roseivivax halodurans]ETX16501.1 hypothetical protein OCH239_01355 [Roseivivax halodurans JCM 10272]